MNSNILKAVPLFSSLNEGQLSLLRPCLQQRSYPRGSFILREGEQTDALYVIVSGRVKVLIPDEAGREVILAVLGINEFFGEMGLLDGQPSSASVETLEACRMLRLSKAGFTAALQQNFELAMVIIGNLSSVCAGPIVKLKVWRWSMFMAAWPVCCWIMRRRSTAH